MRRDSFPCPHCGHHTKIRTSKPMTRVCRELYLQCTNVSCGFTFQAFLEAAYTLSPSGSPDPDVVIPLNPRKEQQAALEGAAATG